ncbi:hypothetical protein N7449_002564 [Penicillium cf. viridicatum]|uniref:Mg2+ transporter protein, CorA-like/Zinc transport protein ZntB n=1 Tax=Penicillium cf. viridicatum TaxID=2972119 RepID=A0A9W9MVR4_9EURO|nr:hypothetical protein N7449_002564 [Penicillium cf. viridicatum]
MAANAPVNIKYWRWTVPPPGGAALPAPNPPPQPSIPGDAKLPKVQDLDQTQLLKQDISIMPKVEDILKMEGSGELCRELVKKFFLPEFFFRRLGWNANGMFGSTENLSQSDKETSYGTFSRFLSKKVTTKDSEKVSTSKPATPEYDYDWHFMAFCTLWRSSHRDSETYSGPAKTKESTDETNILVCFDLDDEFILRLRRLLHNADLKKWEEEPFLMLEFALSIVVDQCEEDLWSFQKPVRNIERVLFALSLLQDTTRGQGVFKKTGTSNNDETFEVLVKRYNQLHELSRHLIHISETMDAASNNLGAIVRDHDLWIESNPRSSAATKRLSKALLLRENMISNLNFRAKAFVSRMDNEIKCASNFVAVGDSNISKDILAQTRNEGKVLSETVSALTLLFLPSTFISGFFGMNFFTLESNQTTQKLQWETHPKIWIFFVCAIPITILGFFRFMLKFDFHVFIKDTQGFIREIFCQGKGPVLGKSKPGTSRNFGFSRRATLRTTQ